MGEKRLHLPDDKPSFAELNRVHDEVLRLRREVEAEEARQRRSVNANSPRRVPPPN